MSQPYFSFELFPPKTESGNKKLQHTVQVLNALNPAYFSVTYGAGGSTREHTFTTVSRLCAQNIITVPHISCTASSKQELRNMLQLYKAKGIRHLVTLRGDLPSEFGIQQTSDFHYASELVHFIRKEFNDWFYLEVAAYPEVHPEAADFVSGLQDFKNKVDAGANAAITQYFYNADSYFYFLESCAKQGIEIPIVPGIMPIVSYTQLARFSAVCGAEIPRWIRKRLESFGDDTESIRAFGLDVVTALCQQLLENGAPGIHFYTLNQSTPTLNICTQLNAVTQSQIR